MEHRVVIVGFGGMGGGHAGIIKEFNIPGVEAVGVYDIREQALENARQKGLKAYESLDAVIDDKTVDMVVVATPNNFHKDLSIKLLRGGKNVICEKPVALNAAELEEIIPVAKETGKVFVVHQNRRWDKSFLILKKIFDEKLLGRPYMIESRVQGSRRGLHGWRGYKINGGGMLYDWGVHLIDQLMWLIPEKVVEVYAQLFKVFSDEVDDNIKVVLRFESGLSALVEVAMNCFILQPRFHMSCADGTAVIQNWECEGKMVKLSQEGELDWAEEIVYTAAGPTRSMAPRPPETTTELPLPEVVRDRSVYYRNVVAAVEGREELIVKPEQSLRVMKVIDAAFDSEKYGASIRVNV